VACCYGVKRCLLNPARHGERVYGIVQRHMRDEWLDREVFVSMKSLGMSAIDGVWTTSPSSASESELYDACMFAASLAQRNRGRCPVPPEFIA